MVRRAERADDARLGRAVALTQLHEPAQLARHRVALQRVLGRPWQDERVVGGVLLNVGRLLEPREE